MLPRASFVELALDYDDYLRQNNCKVWSETHPLRTDFIARKVDCNKDFREFVENAERYFPQIPKDEIVANAVQLLLNLEKYMLSRQIARQSADFIELGGFRERMIQFRRKKREA